MAGMLSVRIAKLIFQAIFFAIFVYQSILAVRKFTTASFIPSVENIDIADAKLPAIYICPENPYPDAVPVENLKKQGYLKLNDFLIGLNSLSWEGNKSLPFRNLTSQLSKPLYNK